jgi:uncharacterized protein YjiS (DUF1127 family)
MSSESQFHHDYPSITQARETARHPNFMPPPGYAFTEGRRERRKLSAAYESQEHSFIGDRLHREAPKKAPWFHHITAAISWLLREIAKGMIAYGEAIYPAYFFDPFGTTADPNGPESVPFTSEHSRRSMPNTAVRHGRGWGVFPKLVGFASRLHHRWKIRQTIIYADDIDDRTLKDIGVTRYELRHAAKHGRQL